MLVVGCPIQSREWIISSWLDHVEDACEPLGVEPVYLFAGNPDVDRTFEVIQQRIHLRGKREWYVQATDEEPREDERTWGLPGRKDHMVDIRNQLLGAVRGIEPELFVSLDSDILAHPKSLRSAIDSMYERGWDAVGSKAYMSRFPEVRNPSFMKQISDHQFQRDDSEGCFAIDVIMAYKVMTPHAYHVDYETHGQGEDIGWSLACRREGLKLGWDGTYCSKHVMKPLNPDGSNAITTIDERCGF